MIKKLKLWRFKIYWDFESRIKSIWLTGWILITWRTDAAIPWYETIDIGFYPSGEYE